MENNQSKSILPIVLIAIVLIGGGAAYFLTRNPEEAQTEVNTPSTPTTESIPESTPENPVSTPTETKQNTKPDTAKTTTEVTPAPVVVKKTVYTNSAAGYTVDLPENWAATRNTAVNDPNVPQVTGTSFGHKNMTGDEQGYTFDIQTATTKIHTDFYKQQYSKTPTYDDLFNSFVESQKSIFDQFAVMKTGKKVVNGNTAYELTASTHDGGGILKFYLFYTSSNTYIIMIQAVASTWPDHESEALSVVESFKIK